MTEVNNLCKEIGESTSPKSPSSPTPPDSSSDNKPGNTLEWRKRIYVADQTSIYASMHCTFARLNFIPVKKKITIVVPQV